MVNAMRLTLTNGSLDVYNNCTVQWGYNHFKNAEALAELYMVNLEERVLNDDNFASLKGKIDDHPTFKFGKMRNVIDQCQMHLYTRTQNACTLTKVNR